MMASCFKAECLSKNGLPTVQFVSEQLYVSSSYLSDMLHNITGQTTQQHIHRKLIERVKELLTTASLTVSEIAYRLGFEDLQSCNKLFTECHLNDFISIHFEYFSL